MGGWAAQTRWQRTGGHGFPVNKPITPEAILSKWDVITNFGEFSSFVVVTQVLIFSRETTAVQRTLHHRRIHSSRFVHGECL